MGTHSSRLLNKEPSMLPPHLADLLLPINHLHPGDGLSSLGRVCCPPRAVIARAARTPLRLDRGEGRGEVSIPHPASRFAAGSPIAERSRVNSPTAAVMASGGSAGFNFTNAARNRDTNTASPFVSRSNVPVMPKVSSNADTVDQPSSANNPMAGCSTS
jgi:hypothetical protein